MVLLISFRLLAALLIRLRVHLLFIVYFSLHFSCVCPYALVCLRVPMFVYACEYQMPLLMHFPGPRHLPQKSPHRNVSSTNGLLVSLLHTHTKNNAKKSAPWADAGAPAR